MEDLSKICYNVEETDDDFVGVKYDNGKIKIIFPLGYRIPKSKDELIVSIKQLFKLIKIVQEKNIDCEDNGEYLKDASGLPIDSYQWIVSDYLNNGIYVDNEKKYCQETKGKINWKRTFKTRFLVSNNSLVYLNPIVEKNSNIMNIISEIHAYCIDRSTSILWFMYSNVQKVSDVRNANLKYYLNIINKELLETFDDRKKLLLYHMKRIIQQEISNDGKNNIRDYGIHHFEYVWEYVVNTVYGTENVKKYYPTATYHINGIPEFEASKLRPDTIMRDANSNMYIIDSKYYKAATVANDRKNLKNILPNTDSIQKQITYGEFMNKNYKTLENIEDIYNAFVIPYNKNDNNLNIKNDVEYLGYSMCNWKDIKLDDSKYLRISLIFMDTKYLIDCYFSKISDKDKLINNIQKVERV